MNDALAVERGQRREAFTQHLNGDARLEARLDRPRGENHAVDVLQALRADAFARPLQRLRSEETAQVVAVEPFHLHDANAILRKEVVDVEEIVVLDQGDAGRDLGDAAHVLLIRFGVAVRFRRKDLEGDREQKSDIRPRAAPLR